MATRRESGFTLVELLVVLVLMGIVGGIVVSAITTSMRSASSTSARIHATQELEIAMQRITRDIRAADPLELSPSGAFDTEAGAQVVRDGESNTVMYALDATGTELHARIVELDENGNPVPGLPTQQLVTSVDNGDTPVFTYLDSRGRELSCSTDCATTYRNAAQVRIELVRRLSDDTRVVVESQVSVRSVRYRSEE